MSKNRPSSIDRLPDEVREEIARLRNSGRTINEIMAVLRSLDGIEQVPSRSALGRHLKHQEKVMERIRESRQLAEALSKNFGDKQTSDVTRMNLELLQDIILRATMAGDDEGNAAAFEPKDIMFLATALEKAAKAGKTDFDQQLSAAREIERRAATEKAADSAVAAAKKQGLSADTIKAIKQSILGVK
ncbi:MAG: phage protein Gp27 family protein [Alphaproteobacteria bacterium]|nr:phage protein Gp27 family protein [Alphaproteobacteria bacterium]